MNHATAHKAGPFWRVTVTRITDEGVFDERVVTGRRYSHIMRQLTEPPRPHRTKPRWVEALDDITAKTGAAA